MKLFAGILAAMTIVAVGAFAEGANEPDSFTISGVDSITVRAGSLDVQVHGTDDSDVTVKADLPQSFWGDPG